MIAESTQLRRILALNNVGLNIQEELKVESIFHLIGEGLKEIGLNCVILFLDDEEKNLKVEYTSQLPSLVATAEKLVGLKFIGFKIPVESKVPAMTSIRERRPIFATNVADIIRELPSPFPAKLLSQLAKIIGIVHIIVVPLIARGKVFGVLAVYSSDLQEEEIPIVVAFANQAAVAIDNAVRLPMEFKAKSKELEESEEKYRRLLEDINDGYAVIQDGKFVFTNGKFTKILGYEPWQIIGKDFGHFVVSSDRQAVYTQYERIICGKEVPLERYEAVGLKKDGTTVNVEVSIKVIQYENKPALSIILRDITERKQAEEQLKQYSENLERMVDERTRELKDAQDKIVRTEKLTAIGELAGLVAHELRNPLGSIRTSTYFLKMKIGDDADEKVARHLDILGKQVNICDRTICYLLDFSRPSKQESMEVDINQVVQRVVHTSEPPQDVKISTNLVGDLSPVIANEGELEQIFFYLISNAIEAMPKGGNLFLNTSQKESFIEVKVIDTGIGIPEENLDKVFEPLFTTKAKGIGLGLALVKALVEREGGTTTVQSQVGKGTVFTIKLPTAREEVWNP